MTHRDGFPRFAASTRMARRCGTSQSHAPHLKSMGRPKALGNRLYGSLSRTFGITPGGEQMHAMVYVRQRAVDVEEDSRSGFHRCPYSVERLRLAAARPCGCFTISAASRRRAYRCGGRRFGVGLHPRRPNYLDRCHRPAPAQNCSGQSRPGIARSTHLLPSIPDSDHWDRG